MATDDVHVPETFDEQRVLQFVRRNRWVSVSVGSYKLFAFNSQPRSTVPKKSVRLQGGEVSTIITTDSTHVDLGLFQEIILTNKFTRRCK